jgi:cytochrome c biogenesis factor/peroxiredoxin
MLSEVGNIALALALATALAAAAATLVGIRRPDRRWRASGRNGAALAAGLLGLALALLEAAFVGDYFEMRAVAQHSSVAMSPRLKAAAAWAGGPGSLLVWGLAQAVVAAIVARLSAEERAQSPTAWAGFVLLVVTAVIVGFTLFGSNPFMRLELPPEDGRGLNPLLRHPGVTLYPMALYLGYAWLAAVVAFSLTAVLTRRGADWPVTARRWLLPAWLWVWLALLLRMRWAYDVLGWGWDPGMNPGLVPWLAATGLLHGAVLLGRWQNATGGGVTRGLGGALVHVGAVLAAIGVVITGALGAGETVDLVRGVPADVLGYTLTYEEARQEPAVDHLETTARVSVAAGDRVLGVLEPRRDRYGGEREGIAVAAQRVGLRENLYVKVTGWSADGATGTFLVMVHPLVQLAWVGGLVMLLGGGLVWAGARSDDEVPTVRGWLEQAWQAVRTPAAVAVFVASAWVIWGAGAGFAGAGAGRLGIGDSAPEFALALVDGETLDAGSLRGKPVIINFWASWCAECRTELPELQVFWEKHEEELTLVGVAFGEDVLVTQETASYYGLSYPVGVDETGEIVTAYGVTGIPETVVVDAEGNVAAVHVGAVTGEVLEEDLARMRE